MKRKGPPPRYPFRKLRVGAQFKVTIERQSEAALIQRRLASHAVRYQRAGQGTFTTRREDMHIVVCRVA